MMLVEWEPVIATGLAASAAWHGGLASPVEIPASLTMTSRARGATVSSGRGPAGAARRTSARAAVRCAAGATGAAAAAAASGSRRGGVVGARRIAARSGRLLVVLCGSSAGASPSAHREKTHHPRPPQSCAVHRADYLARDPSTPLSPLPSFRIDLTGGESSSRRANQGTRSRRKRLLRRTGKRCSLPSSLTRSTRLASVSRYGRLATGGSRSIACKT